MRWLRPVVVSIGMMNAVVLALVVYTHFTVAGAPESTSVRGGPEWQDPTQVAVLSVVVVGAAIAVVVAGLPLMRSRDRSRRRFVTYAVSSFVLMGAGLGIAYDPITWVA